MESGVAMYVSHHIISSQLELQSDFEEYVVCKIKICNHAWWGGAQVADGEDLEMHPTSLYNLTKKGVLSGHFLFNPIILFSVKVRSKVVSYISTYSQGEEGWRMERSMLHTSFEETNGCYESITMEGSSVEHNPLGAGRYRGSLFCGFSFQSALHTSSPPSRLCEFWQGREM